jgi:hypothetical protein
MIRTPPHRPQGPPLHGDVVTEGQLLDMGLSRFDLRHLPHPYHGPAGDRYWPAEDIAEWVRAATAGGVP